MQRSIGFFVLAAMVAICCSPVTGDERGRPKIGDEVAPLKFKDIRYLPRSLADFGEKQAFVLVFTNTTCPLVQKYWPKLKRLEAEYREQGIQFVGVNVGAEDEIQDVAQQAIDFGVEFPVVKDGDGTCVKALGVERTPEVVVLDATKKLRYRGRIDDQYRLGGSRPDVSRDDLKQALDELLAGREIASPESEVDGCLITLSEFQPPEKPPTFHEQISLLLQKHCQECHHTGGSAPFSLVTLDEVSAQAEMIAEVVADRRMPPWHAHRQHTFANQRGLSADERQQIVAWVKSGRAAGDPAKSPPSLVFSDSKWEIGDPDLTLTAFETHELPAEGFVDYKYVVMPHVFLADTWISAAEILPSNPAVVHHCNMAYWKVGQEFSDGNFITGRVPGGTAMILGGGIALRIRPARWSACRSTTRPPANRRRTACRSASASRGVWSSRNSSTCSARPAASPSARCRRPRGLRQPHPPLRRQRPRHVRSHAPPRQRHDVPSPHARRQGRDAAVDSQLPLRLAAELPLAAGDQEIPQGDAD
jgi:thiol-disulfide isomerase/thioredoxin